MAQTITRRARSSHTLECLARIKARKLKKLLDTWLADGSGYDERVWPRLKKAIEQNRPSYRKRFRD
jgi:L-rhamnose isomerase